MGWEDFDHINEQGLLEDYEPERSKQEKEATFEAVVQQLRIDFLYGKITEAQYDDAVAKAAHDAFGDGND